jgi:hypothetical protein
LHQLQQQLRLCGQRLAVDQYAELGVQPFRARIDVDRPDEYLGAIDHPSLGVQAQWRVLARHRPQ